MFILKKVKHWWSTFDSKALVSLGKKEVPYMKQNIIRNPEKWRDINFKKDNYLSKARNILGYIRV